MPKVEIRLNLSALDQIRRAAAEAALETMGAVRTDMISAQVTPRDQGYLEDSGGAIDQSGQAGEIHTTLCIGNMPYARRLYFHPEYTFQDANNRNAQGRWADPWLPGGDRESFIPDTFRACMEKRLPK